MKYLGSTLVDGNDVLSLEVDTQDAHLLSAGTTYVSVVNWMGLTFNSIHAGDEATQIVQISSVRDTSFPPGWKEFAVDITPGRTWCCEFPVCP